MTAAERLSLVQEAAGRHWKLGAGHSFKVGQRGGGRHWRQGDPPEDDVIGQTEVIQVSMRMWQRERKDRSRGKRENAQSKTKHDTQLAGCGGVWKRAQESLKSGHQPLEGNNR